MQPLRLLAPVTRLIDEFSEVRIPLVFKDGAIPNVPPGLEGTIAVEPAVETPEL